MPSFYLLFLILTKISVKISSISPIVHMMKTRFKRSNLSKVTYPISDKARIPSYLCLGFMTEEKRDEHHGNMPMDFYIEATIRRILSNTKNKHLLSLHNQILLSQVIFLERQARMLE